MLRCKQCDGGTMVFDSRPAGFGEHGIRRRRECQKCGHRFSTIEIPIDDQVRVTKLISLAAKLGSSLEQMLSEVNDVAKKLSKSTDNDDEA